MLVWVDLETTGLNEEKDQILEVAVIITEDDLTELWSYATPISVSDYILDNMSEWCKKQHAESGLITDVREGPAKGLVEVEQDLVAALNSYDNEEMPVLAGSSVHFDRKFLKRHLPKFHDCLHYRNVDVSTLKELFRKWGLPKWEREGEKTHRALNDLKGSIEELSFYREFLL